MILIILIFSAMHFCLCLFEYELVDLMDGHKLFLLCRVIVVKVCHMCSFCGNIKKKKAGDKWQNFVVVIVKQK